MRATFLLVLPLALIFAGCAKPIDLTKELQVVDVATGWERDDDPRGQNKLVPTIAFKFKNLSGESLSTLQANVLFRRVGEEQEWGSSFIRVVGSEGLPPGSESEGQRASCPKGYTGTENAPEMFRNSRFVDARVKIFAKYGSTQWTPVGEYVIERRLLP
jgi:hypothetical protein